MTRQPLAATRVDCVQPWPHFANDGGASTGDLANAKQWLDLHSVPAYVVEYLRAGGPDE